jgi:hypothetical protein
MILEIIKWLGAAYGTVSLIALLILIISFGKASIKLWFAKNIEALALIIGIFIFPIQYLFRKSISNNPTLWKWLLLYWFSNTDENSYIDNWYGVYEILNGDHDKFNRMNAFQKFILSYEWVAFRNPSWSLKLLLGRKLIGEIKDEVCIINIGDDVSCGTWRNQKIFGKQYYKFKINSIPSFRYSFTRKLKKFSLFRIFGYKYINFMIGMTEGRYLTKYRAFK